MKPEMPKPDWRACDGTIFERRDGMLQCMTCGHIFGYGNKWKATEAGEIEYESWIRALKGDAARSAAQGEDL